jgi:hypothetical protein
VITLSKSESVQAFYRLSNHQEGNGFGITLSGIFPPRLCQSDHI